MLYTISIRNHSDKVIEAVVEHTQLLSMCHLLERALTVVNYTVSFPGAILAQEKFGVGNFDKWVIQNF